MHDLLPNVARFSALRSMGRVHPGFLVRADDLDENSVLSLRIRPESFFIAKMHRAPKRGPGMPVSARRWQQDAVRPNRFSGDRQFQRFEFSYCFDLVSVEDRLLYLDIFLAHPKTTSLEGIRILKIQQQEIC